MPRERDGREEAARFGLARAVIEPLARLAGLAEIAEPGDEVELLHARAPHVAGALEGVNARAVVPSERLEIAADAGADRPRLLDATAREIGARRLRRALEHRLRPRIAA